MTALEVLAERERLRIRRDKCGDPVIRAPFGNFDDNLDGRIGVCLLKRGKAHWKNRLLALCRKGGPECIAEGDTEAVFLCGPGDGEFLSLAIRALKARRKRRVVMTGERLEQLKDARGRIGKTPP